MNGGDNSLTGGLILASSLIGLNWILGYLQFKNKKLAYWIEGKPTILIHNGRINETELQNEKISHEELNSALRKNGITQVSDVKYAIIEANGNISVIAKLKN